MEGKQLGSGLTFGFDRDPGKMILYLKKNKTWREFLMFPSQSKQEVDLDRLNDDTIDDYVAFLAEVFPETNLEVITKYLLQYKNVEDALIHLKSFVKSKDSISEDSNFDAIIHLFPECDPDFILGLLASSPESDLFELCDDIIQQLIAIDSKSSIPHQNRRKFRPVSLDQSKTKDNAPISNLSFMEALNTTNEAFEYCAPIRNDSLHRAPVKYDFGVDPPTESAEYYRLLMEGLYDERDELYRKAANAYAQSGLHGKSAASYYSQQARNMLKDIETYKKLAVHATFLAHNADLYSNQLDLHGLAVSEALPIASSFLKHHLREHDRYKQVFIVTGSGRRSQNGVRLRPEVYHLLKSQNWRFNFDSLCLFVVFRK